MEEKDMPAGSNKSFCTKRSDISGPESYSPHMCWQFIEQYAPSFAGHFEKCYEEVAGQGTARWESSGASEYLYHILFNASKDRESEEVARKALQSLVSHTLEAETILSYTFFHMIRY